MSESNSTIDDVWSSLQSEEDNKRKEYKTRYDSIKKKSGFGDDNFNLVDIMNQKESIKPKKKALATKKVKESGLLKKTTGKDSVIDDVSMTIHDAITTDTVSNQENPMLISLSELSPKIARYIEGLNSDESNIRRKSLTNLIDHVFGKYIMSAEDYSLLFHDICRSIFRLYGDPIEKCRELSIRLTHSFFDKCINIVPVLSYFFPALMQRLPTNIGYDENLHIFIYDLVSHEAYRRGKAVDRQDKVNPTDATIIPFSFIESSEEIRLSSYQVLKNLIYHMESLDALSILQPYFHDMIMYLQVGLRDPYPEVKSCVLETLERLSKQQKDFELGIKYYAIAIVRAILPILRHRHAKVRASAVTCMTAYVIAPDKAKCKGAGSDAIVDLIGFHEENVLQVAAFYKAQVQINYLAELVMDNTYIVREATVKMLDTLLCDLPDRYDHSSRLLPYLLDFLTDDNQDEVVMIAMNCLSKCGKMYEDEHQDEILERRQYGVDGDHRMNIDKILPYPFHQNRPRLGIRLYVRGHVKRFIHVLIKEIMNWKSNTRLKSVKLLKIAVVLSEESITIEAANIFPALLKSLFYTRYDEHDMVVYHVLQEVSELMGRYIHPDVYLHYLLPRLRGDIEVIGGMGIDAASRVIAMDIISSMISGTKPYEMIRYVDSIISCLCDEYIISRESMMLQSGAMELMIIILDVMKSVSGTRFDNVMMKYQVFEFFIWNLISSSSSSSSSMLSYDRVIRGLELLATIYDESIEQLFQHAGVELLNKMISSSSSSSSSDHDINDMLPCIRCLIEAPYHIVIHDDYIFNVVISYLISKVSSSSTSLSELSSLMCAVLHPITNHHHNAHHMMYRGLPISPSTANDHDIIKASLIKDLPAIIASFTHHHIWNHTITLNLNRLHFIGQLLALSSSSSIATLSNASSHNTLLAYVSSDMILDIISSSFLPTLTTCKHPSYPMHSRYMAASIIHQLIMHVAQVYNISHERLKPYHQASSYDVSIHACIQPMISLLIDMISDGADEVRIMTINALSSAVVFIISDDVDNVHHSQYSYRFSRVVNIMIDEMLSFNHVIVDHDMMIAVESVLRSMAVLNPIRMEELIRVKIDAGGVDVHHRQLLSELIDHASLLADLQRLPRS